MEQVKVLPLTARLGIAALLTLMGFVFPLLFIPAAFVVWGIIDERRNPIRPEDHPWTHARSASSADPDWRERWLKVCESPAEEAFLNAMLDAYSLNPLNGKLVGVGITLDLQVSIDRYRVDFLANQCHVIEIDGAAFHTGAEVEACDAYRDTVLGHCGYKVLRIPARMVFRTPQEALCRVAAYLADAAPVVPKPLPAEQPPKPQTAYQRSIDENLRKASERVIAGRRTASETPQVPILDPEFRRMLAERVQVRWEQKRKEINNPFVEMLMQDRTDKSIERDEEANLRVEWAARAAAVPADPKFKYTLEARVEARVSEYFKPGNAYRERMRDVAEPGVRARYRWEEEGLLIEEWTRKGG